MFSEYIVACDKIAVWLNFLTYIVHPRFRIIIMRTYFNLKLFRETFKENKIIKRVTFRDFIIE